MSDEVSPYDEEAPAEQALPTVDELIAETADIEGVESAGRWQDESTYDEDFEQQVIVADRAWVHLTGLRDHYKHKKNWSIFLMALLAGMVLFQWVLLGFVGFGWWDFTQYRWLLPILLVQNLGQIIGLAFVVVRSLFKDLES